MIRMLVAVVWVPVVLMAEFPDAGLLPKIETGVQRLVEADSERDGRGIIVAIFDSGVDPGVEGLQTTSDGRPKIIDLIDATGSGDVDTSTVGTPEDGQVMGLTGRELILPEGAASKKEVFLGIKAGWEIFPQSLVGRLQEERRRTFFQEHAALEASVRNDESLEKKEREARLAVLSDAKKAYRDPGPIFDCVVYQKGDLWRAVIDTDEDGDLRDEVSLTDYTREHQYASFGEQSQLNFTVTIHDEGKRLEIVVPANMHGSHVAGIVGAHYPETPILNGLAPGVQIVSVKIGDSRLGGMETGSAVIRGLEAVRRHGCQLVNMSYGEPTRLPGQGRVIEYLEELVHEDNVLFVASAGNAGPALTTVGAPGGASEAFVSVGAVVTPAMMQAGYALRETRSDLAYTWSSRGPAAHGGSGVTIAAPGGALSPVPRYTLRRNRYANGTSMSSPNACGSLAVLIGALRAESIPYTASSLKQVIANTAVPIPGEDRFSQGQGMLRVDRALALLQEHAIPLAPRYEVRIPSRDGAPGLYLREYPDNRQPSRVTISVEPRFARTFPNESKLQLNRKWRLESTVPWLACPEHLFITNKATTFEVEIDPSITKHGVYTGEIVATDAEAPEWGAVLRIPATLIRPRVVREGMWSAGGQLARGDVRRFFLTPPEGATQATLTFTNETTVAQRVIAHVMQTLPQRRHEESGQRWRLTVDAGESVERRLAIMSGKTVEVAIASNWDSAEDLKFRAEMAFEGLQADTRTLYFHPGETIARLEVRSAFPQQRLSPQGNFTHWQAVIPPGEKAVRALNEQHHDHQIYEAMVDYQFTLEKSARITPRFPDLNRRLYEADVQSQIFTITDSNGQRVAADDGWEPHAVSLRAGDYCVHYHWRHDDVELLEKLAERPLVLEGALGSAVPISVHETRREGVNGRRMSARTLSEGSLRPLHLTAPSAKELPKLPITAQHLKGELRLHQDAPGAEVRLIYALPPSSPTAEHPPKGLREHALVRLEALLAKGDEKAFDKALETFRKHHRDGLEADWLALQRMDTVAMRKKDHRAIVKKCDRLLKEIDEEALAEHRGQRRVPGDDDEKSAAFALEYRVLVDVLYRKCRAIAYHDGEREKAGKDYEVEPFEKAFRHLRRWVDTESPDYVLAHIRWHRRHGRFGQALQLLNRHMKDAPSTRLLHDKRVKILGRLGWTAWAELEEQWNRRRFVPFLKE